MEWVSIDDDDQVVARGHAPLVDDESKVRLNLMSATDFSEWRKCSSRRLRERREREERSSGESGGLD